MYQYVVMVVVMWYFCFRLVGILQLALYPYMLISESLRFISSDCSSMPIPHGTIHSSRKEEKKEDLRVLEDTDNCKYVNSDRICLWRAKIENVL